jgi:dihydrofolate reductase
MFRDSNGNIDIMEQFNVPSAHAIDFESPRPCIMCEDLNQALCVSNGYSNNVFVKGGVSLIMEVLPTVNRIIMIDVNGVFNSNVKAPVIKKDWKIKPITEHIQYNGDSHSYQISEYVRR